MTPIEPFPSSPGPEKDIATTAAPGTTTSSNATATADHRLCSSKTFDPDRTPVIGFCGFKRSGKDTAASLFSMSTKLAFAKPLKDMLQLGLGMTWDQLYGEDKEVMLSWLDATPRHMMETLGTKWGREMIDRDLWVKVLKQRILQERAKRYVVIDAELYDAGVGAVPVPIIVTDVRTENEARMIRELGGLVIHVRRGPPEGFWASIRRRFGPLSERGIAVADEDYIVVNNGTIEHLHRQVKGIYSDRFKTEIPVAKE